MKTKGFSLIELMVVTAIISILVSFGFNTYNDSKLKTVRKIEQQYVLQLPSLIEQFFLAELRYPDNLNEILTPENNLFYSPKKYYLISYKLNLDNSYSVTATVNANTVGSEFINCYHLTVKSTGEVLALDEEDNDIYSECWD